MKILPLLRRLIPSRAMLRLTTYLIVAFAAAAFLAARSLRADVTEAALSAGHQLAKLADLVGDAETIVVNGERMHHSSTYVQQDVATVLQRVEDYCSESPSFLGRALSHMSDDELERAKQRVPDSALRSGFIRDIGDKRGMIACFVDTGPSTFRDLGERLTRFLTSMQLGEFGHFRYVYAEAAAAGRTHVIATWADTRLDLPAMFPQTGDAAGSDSTVVPRPPSSRRTFTAAAEGHPHAIRIYNTQVSPRDVLAHYDAWAATHGFAQVRGAHDLDGTSAYMRDDVYQVFVTIGEQAGHSFVTVTESGKSDASNLATVEVVP